MLRIIGVVVVDVHGGERVETIDEHSLTIGIDEANRTCYLRHSFLASPVLNGLEQGGTDLWVVHEIEPAEAYLLTIPTLVGTVVDDSRHTSYQLAVAEGHEILGLAALKGSILVFSQCRHLFTVDIGNSILAVAIKVVEELHKLLQFLASSHWFNFNLAHGTFYLSVCKITAKN